MTFDDIEKMRISPHPVPRNIFSGTKMPKKDKFKVRQFVRLDASFRQVGTEVGKKRQENFVARLIDLRQVETKKIVIE